MTHPDFRALCAELLGALADQWVGDERPDPDVVIRACAALAAPQQGAPSDDDVRVAFMEGAGSHPTQNTTMNTPTTPDQLLDYWPGNIPFKGKLVSDDGTCMCAQGQALHFLDGVSSAELHNYDQAAADKRVAELFDISRAHAMLLRIINDGRPGAPSVVIRDPAEVLGDQTETVLAFWRHLDRMTTEQWDAARDAAAAAAWDAAWHAAVTATAAARDAAWHAAVHSAAAAATAAAWHAALHSAAVTATAAARDAAWHASPDAAAAATNEIQGAAVLRAQGRPFYFLPMFGIAQPEDLLASNEVKP
jgi:hypothetical protein